MKGFLVLCVISHLIVPAETQSESKPTQHKLVNGSITIDLEWIQADKINAKFTRNPTLRFRSTATIRLSVWLLSSNRISVQHPINNDKLLSGTTDSVEVYQTVGQMKNSECDAIVVSLEFHLTAGNIYDALFVTLANHSIRMFST